MYPSLYSFILLSAEAFIGPSHFYKAVAFFCGLILVVIVGMLLILIRKNWQAIRRKQLKQQFQDWLVGIILEETAHEDQPFEVPENIRTLLQSHFARQVLLQELKQLKSSLSGQSGMNLEKLYQQLELQKLSLRKLRSRLWYRQAEGIQELAIMNQTGFAAEINALTNHRHAAVRMEAQIAMVFLQQYQGLHFFENLVYPLTEWHQLKLLHLLSSQALPSVEMIDRWLQSPNNTVVQFTLKLIGEQYASIFQQQVANCLNHPDEAIRRQALSCLGEIVADPAALALQELFDQQNRVTIPPASNSREAPALQELRQTPQADLRQAENTLLPLQDQVAA